MADKVKPRYTIFGCSNDRLIESKAVFLGQAMRIASRSSDGFKARIWDGLTQRFVGESDRKYRDIKKGIK